MKTEGHNASTYKGIVIHLKETLHARARKNRKAFWHILTV
jgi:hypothetical protein